MAAVAATVAACSAVVALRDTDMHVLRERHAPCPRDVSSQQPLQLYRPRLWTRGAGLTQVSLPQTPFATRVLEAAHCLELHLERDCAVLAGEAVLALSACPARAAGCPAPTSVTVLVFGVEAADIHACIRRLLGRACHAHGTAIAVSSVGGALVIHRPGMLNVELLACYTTAGAGTAAAVVARLPVDAMCMYVEVGCPDADAVPTACVVQVAAAPRAFSSASHDPRAAVTASLTPAGAGVLPGSQSTHTTTVIRRLMADGTREARPKTDAVRRSEAWLARLVMQGLAIMATPAALDADAVDEAERAAGRTVVWEPGLPSAALVERSWKLRGHAHMWFWSRDGAERVHPALPAATAAAAVGALPPRPGAHTCSPLLAEVVAMDLVLWPAHACVYPPM